MVKTLVRRIPVVELAGRWLIDKRYGLARRYIRGTGIEIGALDRPLYLPRGAKAEYVDRMPSSELHAHYPELKHRRFYVSIVGDGEKLDFIEDASQDFIIANHMIEHCEDPISTLRNFSRCLKSGAVAYLAVPDRNKTFDHKRELTTVDHLRRDYREGPVQSRYGHYLEWAELVECKRGNEAKARAKKLETENYSIHFHCWTRSSFTEFIQDIESETSLSVAEIASWRNENIFILTKQ